MAKTNKTRAAHSVRKGTALIIGGSSSIAGELIGRFINSGNKVVATFNDGQILKTHRSDVHCERLDLGDMSQLDNFCNISLSAYDCFDYLIFFNGILPGKPLNEYSDDLISKVMFVNFISQAALLRRLLHRLSEEASIVFVSSISAERGSFDPIYAASKSAQLGLIKSLAKSVTSKLRVNAVLPSLIESSKMFSDMPLNQRNFHLAQSPSGRLLSVSEVAAVIFDISSARWSGVNGQLIRVNHGVW